jgi:acyl-CoA reductase-like NAD-dependent aldehyde dehydrogenase
MATERLTERLSIRKTYKLYIGGAFPRSESGRTYEVTDARGGFLANASLASRKDVRDAVVAARKAFGGWSGRTPYNRGQILYRVAEMLEGRRVQFVDELEHLPAPGAGAGPRGAVHAAAEVDAAIDRWVWYAGWADKVASIAGSVNAVSGPFHNTSTPEPTGVVGVIAPDSPLLGLVSVIAPVIATGNTCVVVASEPAPLAAITLGEVLATSDLPGGVVNLLTGRRAELAPWLASHMDVNAIDLTGAAPDQVAELERAAADNLKRVFRPAADRAAVSVTDDGGGGRGGADRAGRGDGAADTGAAVGTASGSGTAAVMSSETADWTADPGLTRLQAFLETKTVWHPIGV